MEFTLAIISCIDSPGHIAIKMWVVALTPGGVCYVSQPELRHAPPADLAGNPASQENFPSSGQPVAAAHSSAQALLLASPPVLV